MIYKIAIQEEQFEVEIGEISDGCAKVTVNGTDYDVTIDNYDEMNIAPAPVQPVAQVVSQAPAAAPPRPATRAPAPPAAASAPAQPAAASQSPGSIIAPIPGRIITIKVNVGDSVTAGQNVATMEAMKMENNIVCPSDGTVKEILVQQGSEVATGDVIMVIG